MDWENATRRQRFEQALMPHLDAAYNLARWLARNGEDAEDIVQEACLRAFRFLDGFRGEAARSWFLSIVRNTYYDWRRKNHIGEPAEPFDEELHSPANGTSTPEAAALANADRSMLHQALGELPAEFREILVLREMEGLSYQEIACVAGIPAGTVMSRLARARRRLAQCYKEAQRGL